MLNLCPGDLVNVTYRMGYKSFPREHVIQWIGDVRRGIVLSVLEQTDLVRILTSTGTWWINRIHLNRMRISDPVRVSARVLHLKQCKHSNDLEHPQVLQSFCSLLKR